MKDADVTHGAAGRPAARASMMAPININWCMTEADLDEDEAEVPYPSGPDLMEKDG